MTTKAERFIRDHLGDDAARPVGNPEAADWHHEQMVWTFDDGSTLTVGGEQVTCGRREAAPASRRHHCYSIDETGEAERLLGEAAYDRGMAAQDLGMLSD